MIELGVDSIAWHSRIVANEVELPAVIEQSAEIGASFVQVGMAQAAPLESPRLEELAAIAAERGVRLEAYGGGVGRRVIADHDSAVEAMSRFADRARTLGATYLMVTSGVYMPDLIGRPDLAREELEALRDVVRAAGPLCAEKGIEVLIENSSDFRVDELEWLLAEVEDSNAGLFLDITNPYNVFENPVDTVARLAPVARAGHIKDIAFDSKWSETGFHRRSFELTFVYPGEGMADARGALTALVDGLDPAARFPLSIEGLASRPGVGDEQARLEASLEFVRAILDEVTIAQTDKGRSAS